MTSKAELCSVKERGALGYLFFVTTILTAMANEEDCLRLKMTQIHMIFQKIFDNIFKILIFLSIQCFIGNFCTLCMILKKTYFPAIILPSLFVLHHATKSFSVHQMGSSFNTQILYRFKLGHEQFKFSSSLKKMFFETM